MLRIFSAYDGGIARGKTITAYADDESHDLVWQIAAFTHKQAAFLADRDMWSENGSVGIVTKHSDDTLTIANGATLHTHERLFSHGDRLFPGWWQRLPQPQKQPNKRKAANRKGT
jgi:hypothetical protein